MVQIRQQMLIHKQQHLMFRIIFQALAPTKVTEVNDLYFYKNLINKYNINIPVNKIILF